jgi:urease accessory protein
MTMRRGAAAAAIGGLLLPQWAWAHEGAAHAHASGFAHGFLHPLSGLDHLLAMVLVGLLAVQLGGRALLALPASFLALMAAGGAAGLAGLGLPHVEVAIALSVVALGAALAFAIRTPVAAAALAVGGFALFHGFAHGAELPAGAGAAGYAAGFLLATALLHGAGLALGLALGRRQGRAGGLALRASGAASAVAGLGLLVGLV